MGRPLPDGDSSIVETLPMAPFALAGGESRSLVVRLGFSDCEWFMPGDSQTLVAWELRYRVLGLSKSAPAAAGPGASRGTQDLWPPPTSAWLS